MLHEYEEAVPARGTRFFDETEMPLKLIANNIFSAGDDSAQNGDFARLLPSEFSYLLRKSGRAARPAGVPHVVHKPKFIASAEALMNGFAAAECGAATFSTTVGVRCGLTDSAGTPIYLYQDPANRNVLLGVIGDLGGAPPSASTPLAFALALNKTSATTGVVYLVQYAAFYSSDTDDPDDHGGLSGRVIN